MGAQRQSGAGPERAMRSDRAAPRTDGAAVARIVERARQGDRDAIARLYRLYREMVRSYVGTIVRDRSEAEDVTQQVFIRLMGTIDHYERGEAPFTAWLRRVAHNVAIDHLRHRRPIPLNPRHTTAPPLGRVIESSEIREAIETLGFEQRQVLVLRHIVGLSPPEIAELMETTESAVHSLHYRARRALKIELADRQLAPLIARAG